MRGSYAQVPANPGGQRESKSGFDYLTTGERLVLLLFLMILLATFGMVIYLMLHRGDYLDRGDTVLTNSSRIGIVDNGDGSVVFTLVDQHAYYGWANYSCHPNAPIQPIPTIPVGGQGTLEETWYTVLLYATIENTDSSLFSLQDNLYTVRLTEPGAYLVHSEVDVAVPTNLTDPVSLCSFVDVETIGLFDVLRRVAPTCSSTVFNGNPDYGPMLIATTFDMFSITDPVEIQIRVSGISDVSSQLGIILASLKVAKL